MMPDSLQNEARIRIGVTLLLVALLAVGFWLRVRNLGALGLELDEGHQALAVRGILKHGLPFVPSGELYSRGWPFLYLEAGTAAIFGVNEFALRLPSVLFGTVSIYMIYLLGFRVFSRTAGLVAAVIFTLSIWEIEFARYARMYTAFQFVYLIALYNFYRGYIEGDRRHQLLLLLTAALAISLHDLGIMLATLFVIPFALRRYTVTRPAVLALNAASIGLFWLLFPRLIKSISPPRVEGTGAVENMMIPGEAILRQMGGAAYNTLLSNFKFPPMGLIRKLFHDEPILLAFGALVLLGGCGYLAWSALRSSDRRVYLLLVGMLLVIGVHQYGLALLLGLVLLFLFWDHLIALGRKPILVWAGASGILSLIWLELATGARLSAVGLKTGNAFFAYPAFYRYFLRWYWEGWPILTVFIGFGLAWFSFKFSKDQDPAPWKFLCGSLMIPAIFTGFLKVEFYEARYTFHLFPLVVLIGAFLFVEISRHLWSLARRFFAQDRWLDQWSIPVEAAIAVLLAFVITQDINPVEAYGIGDRSYRSPRNGVKAHINWNQYSFFHQDHRTAALYVREWLGPGDKIIVMGHPHRASIYYHYIGRVDYVFAETDDTLYRKKDGQVFHYMTGSIVIEDLDSIDRMIRAPRDYRIWLLGDRQLLGPGVNTYYPETKATVSEWLEAGHTRCEGEDGVTFCVALESPDHQP